MASITPADYAQIAGYYSDIRTLLDTLPSKLYNAADLIVHLDEFDPTVDLINPFYSTYVAQTKNYDSNSGLLTAVRALNNHVILRSGFSSIDEFLASTTPDTTVPQAWADMCAEVGITISNAYIV